MPQDFQKQVIYWHGFSKHSFYVTDPCNMVARKEIIRHAHGTHKDPDLERMEATSHNWEEPEQDSNGGSTVLPLSFL